MLIRLKPNHTDLAQHADLTLGNQYRVIGIEADDFRLLNDEGQPYLYPAEFFEVVDPVEPMEWETTFGDEGERYAYPPAMCRPGFFEDYFDDDPQAHAILRHYLAKQRTTTLTTHVDSNGAIKMTTIEEVARNTQGDVS